MAVCGSEKANLEKLGLGLEEFQQAMRSQFDLDEALYAFKENDKSYYFELKEEAMAQQLIPFLEKVYPMLHPVRSGNTHASLDKLRNAPPSQWLDLVEEQGDEYLQMDNYGDFASYVHAPGTQRRARVFSSSIMISMEGKIMMEEYGRQFGFFEQCVRLAFPEFPIASALRIYITG